MIEKASIYTMKALNKSSELWHTSVNRKARPVVEREHDKSWNDHAPRDDRGIETSKITDEIWICMINALIIDQIWSKMNNLQKSIVFKKVFLAFFNSGCILEHQSYSFNF